MITSPNRAAMSQALHVMNVASPLRRTPTSVAADVIVNSPVTSVTRNIRPLPAQCRRLHFQPEPDLKDCLTNIPPVLDDALSSSQGTNAPPVAKDVLSASLSTTISPSSKDTLISSQSTTVPHDDASSEVSKEALVLGSTTPLQIPRSTAATWSGTKPRRMSSGSCLSPKSGGYGSSELKLNSPESIMLLSPRREDARKAHSKLIDVAQDLSKTLGAAHPIVEQARRDIHRVRKREEELRWRELSTWHEGNIGAAISSVEAGGHINELQLAVKLAQASELGPAHAICQHGEKELTKWKKTLAQDELVSRGHDHVARMRAAEATGNLNEFEATIIVAAKELGSSHPEVEGARQAYRKLRKNHQHMERSALVEKCTTDMLVACESNDGERIHRCHGEVTSKLGMAHPVSEYGRNYLLNLRKQLLRDRSEQVRRESARMLRDAVKAAEESLERLEEEVDNRASRSPLRICNDK